MLKAPLPLDRIAAPGTLAHLQGPVRLMADGLLAVLLAPVCGACEQPLEAPTAGAVCAGCWAAVRTIAPPLCDTCGEPLPSWRVISLEQSRCARCRRRPSSVARGRAVGAYDGSLRAIVHALKYDGRQSVARRLARLMAEHGAEVMTGADFCVPVPLHGARQRARGYNQAAELARHLGPPVANALRRTRRTSSQTDLPAARRHANVRGAFAMTRGACVRDSIVLLVDDVSTTGATLDACARVLLEAGAREVRSLTAAKAVSRLP